MKLNTISIVATIAYMIGFISFIIYAVNVGTVAFVFGQNNTIAVADQIVTDEFVISFARVQYRKGAYISVRRDNGLLMGFIVGLSEFLPPGEYHDVHIPLNFYPHTKQFPQIASGDHLYATLFEKSEKQPPSGVDPLYGSAPLKDYFGNAVIADFTVR